MLVEGRKFGIRLWAVVTSADPLRAYLHTKGLVLFSTHGWVDARGVLRELHNAGPGAPQHAMGGWQELQDMGLDAPQHAMGGWQELRIQR